MRAISLIPIIAVLTLVSGCAAAAPEASSPPPSPPATSEATAPVATVEATPSPDPVDGGDAPPECDHALVLTGETFGGTDEEAIAQASPHAGFEPSSALEGLDVLCALTYTVLLDGGGGQTGVVSIAFVEGDDDVEPTLEAWADANDYVGMDGAEVDGYHERYGPQTPADYEGSEKIMWYDLGWDALPVGQVDEYAMVTGLDLDDSDYFISHLDSLR